MRTRLNVSWLSRAILCVALAASASCASDDGAKKDHKAKVGKHRFTPADYNLDFLEPDKTAERLSPMVVDKIRAVLDHMDNKLPGLLAPIPQPAPQLIQLAADKGKPILQHKLQEKLTALIAEHRSAVDPVVQKYDVFQDPELSYDLVEGGSEDVRAMLERTNATLKDAYRTARAIRVARKMLAVARTDAAQLKDTPSPAALAGVGVAALSITELSLEAIEDSQQLLPELKQLAQDLTNQVGANPLMAMSLAGALGAVTEASAALTSVPTDAAELLGEAAELLTLFES